MIPLTLLGVAGWGDKYGIANVCHFTLLLSPSWSEHT